jgi:hypothetical protein
MVQTVEEFKVQLEDEVLVGDFCACQGNGLPVAFRSWLHVVMK